MKKNQGSFEAMGRETGAQILGIHLEGPFLSPARIGGQLAEGISPVDLGLMGVFIKRRGAKLSI